ncbi:MAG: hypothetical protein WB607_05445 [Candidatus Acidiferrum sp.]
MRTTRDRAPLSAVVVLGVVYVEPVAAGGQASGRVCGRSTLPYGKFRRKGVHLHNALGCDKMPNACH